MDPTSDLDQIYRQVVLDHSRQPRNFRMQSEPTASAVGHNRLCGDKLELFLSIGGETIDDISFQGSGCAISTASASMMTEINKGATIEQAHHLFSLFHQLLTQPTRPALIDPALGKLVVFAGVREFPARVKCATLPWHTLQAALLRSKTLVSTE